MSIRWKLMILLLLMTLGPLAISKALDARAIRNLGSLISTEVRQAFAEDARHDLLRTIEAYASIIERESAISMLTLELQAMEIEARLNQPQPPQNPLPVFFSHDFDQNPEAIPGAVLSQHHGRLLPDGTITPRWVSMDHPVIHLNQNTNLADVRGDVERLADLAEPLAHLAAGLEGVLWQYVALENGLHVSWPGKGEYPPDYDSRQRAWYRSVAQSRQAGWQPPEGDVTTGRAVMTAGMPIYRTTMEDGVKVRRFAGVTGLDVPLAGVLGVARLNTPWADRAELLLIRLEHPEDIGSDDAPPLPDRMVPIVFAQSSFREEFQDWRQPPRFRVLGLPEGQGFEEVLDDMARGRQNVREVVLNGRRQMCTYGPMGIEGESAAFLVVLAPFDAIMDQVHQLEGKVNSQFAQLLQFTGGIMFLVTLLVIVLAYRGSARVTRPIRELAAAAEQIAAGRLDVPISEPKGRDEPAQLLRSFRTMVPALRDHMQLRESLRLATEVQQSLLPAGPPNIDGLEVAGISRYCDQTGGDYYDYVRFQQIGPRCMAAAIGDVTGHGIAAALLMATARGMLRGRIAQEGSLADAFGDINRQLTLDQSHGRFMTLFYTLIDTDHRRLRWISCGHDPAWLINTADGTTQMLEGADIPLGIERDWTFNEFQMPIPEQESLLVMGTDGLWETTNPEGRFFGKQRLLDEVQAHRTQPVEEIGRAVIDAVDRFRSSGKQKDDLTLVLIRIAGLPKE